MPKWLPKSSRPGAIDSLFFCVLEGGEKNMNFWYLFGDLKIRKIGPENAQDMVSRQEPVAKGVVLGGLGPWGGHARDKA